MSFSDQIITLSKIFQKKIKNRLHLSKDTPLSESLRPIKVGEDNSPIAVSKDKVNIDGTFLVNGAPFNPSITALNNPTENELVTVGATTTELESEANLTYDGTELKIVGSGSLLELRYNASSRSYITINSDGDLTQYVNGTGSGNGTYKLDISDDMVIDCAGTTGAGEIRFEPSGVLLLKIAGSSLFQKQQVNAEDDVADFGQVWVKNDTPNNLYFTDDTGQDIPLTSNGEALGQIKTAEVTIDEAGMNALHSTEQTIVAAQGSNLVIIPTSGMLFVDRDGSTAQADGNADLVVGWGGADSYNTDTIYYIRRFMYNEGGDRIYHLQHYSGECGQSLTAGDNEPLTIKLDSAITSGSIDSMKVVVSYFVYDNS